jgi:uncharacterized repeat protein (TIGR03803 family)
MIMPVARLLFGHGLAFGNRVHRLSTLVVLGFTLSAFAQNIQYQRLSSLGTPPLVGRRPYGGVIQADNGALYGTTAEGGASNSGTIFLLNPNGSNATNLYTFGLVAGDGQTPMALVQGSDGALYGTTIAGGTNNNNGTAYKINKNGTGYQVLHNFGTVADGKNPQAGLIEGTDGFLYGTTFSGGSNDFGTVFKLKKDGTSYAILHHFNFNGVDGYNPDTALLQGRDGMLYGTTFYGGNSDVGTIFKINTNGTSYLVLYKFSGLASDGQNPDGALIQGSDSALYGTTFSGGTNGAGTIFKLGTNGSPASYAVLHTFISTGGDGQKPLSALLEARDGLMYGTTYAGGSNGLGTVFILNKDGTGYAVVHNFSASSGDGQNPHAGLVQGSDLALYGTTWNGGDSAFGTVQRLLPVPTPRMLDVVLAGNSAKVRFTGVSNNHYQVYRSTNLVSWSLLSTLTMPASGIGTNVDANPVFPAASYRAAWVP